MNKENTLYRKYNRYLIKFEKYRDTYEWGNIKWESQPETF
jgi:hypothetical protein